MTLAQFADRIHDALADIFGEKGRAIKTYLAEVRRVLGPSLALKRTGWVWRWRRDHRRHDA